MSNDLKDSGTRQAFVSGAVRDAQENKGTFHLVPPLAVFLLARIYEMGAKKYASRNWEKGMPVSRFIDSAQRHLSKYVMGMRDEPHLSMAMWNITGALWTASMVHYGLRDASFNDLPNHVGSQSWDGQEIDSRWAAPPLSPMEIESLNGFGMKQEKKVEDKIG